MNNKNKILNDINKNSEKIKKDVMDVLNYNVAPKIKQVMTEKAETKVYAAYSPVQYKRRKEENGLVDKKLMKHTVEQVGSNQFRLRVFNEADFNSKTRPKGDSSLAVFINNGYGDKEKPYEQPRPFLDETQNDNEWKEIFKSGMKNKERK